MALDKHTPDELDDLARLIREAADTMQWIAEEMRKNSMPLFWFNSKNAQNKLIPEIRKFSRKAKSDFETELEAFLKGKASPAELNRIRSELNRQYVQTTEKPAAAAPSSKKPAKKKGT